ncbi:DUF4247 domain-containing protein [Aquibacillus rhizosphaerae]|uniref:DUF4247 domain-containing protein n=1 Tax=Aquibacillus rhizosphaerae TaxID=3051431 RepID=A0ABT7L636_9BACI|nr:DUF4247 domain-containing protein [Aquibacillus sp. LR5S19]MDL4841328.1 DUF4247 domain-containing protein [Aquibacillus sp. LR5S19]
MKNSIVQVLFGVLILIGLTACGSSQFSGLGTNEQPDVSVDNIPDEPSKQELISQIEASDSNSIEPIIANNFYLLDTVSGDNESANVYATKQFEMEELVSVISDSLTPDEKSEVKDNQQILIYPNHFVTFKLSEEDSSTILMEVANDNFVRNNYSPNYLNSFFTFALINRMLSADNWAQNRRNQCSNGACYGGYSTNRSQNQGGVTSNRGMSTVRGGGPSAGK